jgi:hypothetical protein
MGKERVSEGKEPVDLHHRSAGAPFTPQLCRVLFRDQLERVFGRCLDFPLSVPLSTGRINALEQKALRPVASLTSIL